MNILYTRIISISNLEEKMKINQDKIEKLILENEPTLSESYKNPNGNIFIDVWDYEFSNLANFYYTYCESLNQKNDFFLSNLLFGLHNLKFEPFIVEGEEYSRFDSIPRCTYHYELKGLLENWELKNFKSHYDEISNLVFSNFGVNFEFRLNEIDIIKEIIKFYQAAFDENKDIICILIWDV